LETWEVVLIVGACCVVAGTLLVLLAIYIRNEHRAKYVYQTLPTPAPMVGASPILAYQTFSPQQYTYSSPAVRE